MRHIIYFSICFFICCCESRRAHFASIYDAVVECTESVEAPFYRCKGYKTDPFIEQFLVGQTYCIQAVEIDEGIENNDLELLGKVKIYYECATSPPSPKWSSPLFRDIAPGRMRH